MARMRMRPVTTKHSSNWFLWILFTLCGREILHLSTWPPAVTHKAAPVQSTAPISPRDTRTHMGPDDGFHGMLSFYDQWVKPDLLPSSVLLYMWGRNKVTCTKWTLLCRSSPLSTALFKTDSRAVKSECSWSVLLFMFLLLCLDSWQQLIISLTQSLPSSLTRASALNKWSLLMCVWICVCVLSRHCSQLQIVLSHLTPSLYVSRSRASSENLTHTHTHCINALCPSLWNTTTGEKHL